MMKKVTIVFIIATNFLLLSFKQPPVGVRPQKSLGIIVIDPGHGGKDEGAAGSYSLEKDVTLAIGLKLRDAIHFAMPDVKVIMTRTTDVFDAPQVKAAKANAAKGDLFICIHCNYANPARHSELTGYTTQTYYTGKGGNRKKHTRQIPQNRYSTTPNPAKGTETYIWGADRNTNKELAIRENESLYLDSGMVNSVAGFDPGSPEKSILYSLKTQQYFRRSSNFALFIEDEFAKIGRTDRGAQQRQEGIWVLQATAMPSVLIETGFLSNPEEEDYLNSEIGQQQITGAVVSALQRYKTSLENNQ